ncbi:MAG TPA: hypothetical protein VKI23_02670, partial [Cellulomonadaceae bacterium]|nr:hypothetical protein [Cellulomonadaceae bacterium]
AEHLIVVLDNVSPLQQPSPRPPEIHLFVLWEHARPWADRIVADIEKTFRILDAIELRWTSERGPRHFTRLYAQPLPPESQKLRDCGSGAPLILVLSDDEPRYGRRRKWGSTYTVNTHLFDAKRRYRALTGGSRVHCTTDVAETEHDLFVLLGLRSVDYANRQASRWGRMNRAVERDLTGDGGWASLDEMLTAVELTLAYVRLPDVDAGPEVRLLVAGLSSHCGVEWLISEPDRHPKGAETRCYPATIEGREVVVELRHVGDGHHARAWQEGMLERRVRDSGGTFVLPPDDAFLELSHELVRRGASAPGDVRRLDDLARAAGLTAPGPSGLDVARERLEAALRQRGYDKGPAPTDPDGPRPSLVSVLADRLGIYLRR